MARASRDEQLAADVVVDLDVGATEAVDRLLRVADDEQLARHGPHGTPVPLGGIVRGQQQQELGLERIGVLELVDEDTGAP